MYPKSKPTFLLCLTMILNLVSAQENSTKIIDSLENILNLSDNNFQKAYTRLDIAQSVSGLDSTKAYDNAKLALSFFIKNKDTFGLAKAYATLGNVFFDYNEMAESEFYYKKAKHLFESQLNTDTSKSMVDLWADTALNLAASIGNQGRNDEELEYLIELAPVVKKYKNYKVLAIINTNIAITFFNNDDFKKAYLYFKGNNVNYQKTKAYSQFATDRLIFSSCLLNMDSLVSAKKEIDNAKNILNNITDSPVWQLYHQQLGQYYTKVKNYSQALKEYDHSIQLIASFKNYTALPQQYLEYVTLYTQMGNKPKAKEYMHKFYEVSKTNNDSDALYALQELAKLEYTEKNYKKGMVYALSYFNANDSLKNQKVIQETTRLEQLYQKEKKDREIAELQKQKNETDLILEKKKSQNYLLFILSGSLIFVLVSGYLSYRNQQKRVLLKHKEQDQQIQILKNKKARNLFGVMMEGVEQERKRLAADLHDGLGGRLASISIKLSKLSDTGKIKIIAPELDDVLNNIDDAMQELRGIARNLMPETLIKYGLKAAIEDYCSTLRQKDTNISLQYFSDKNLEVHTKLVLYRIIQELINNAIKHAKATEILVQFMQNHDKIDITVEDDGVGFNYKDPTYKNSSGLTNLKNRVKFLNGKMEINSVIGEGTSISIQINEHEVRKN